MIINSINQIKEDEIRKENLEETLKKYIICWKCTYSCYYVIKCPLKNKIRKLQIKDFIKE